MKNFLAVLFLVFIIIGTYIAFSWNQGWFFIIYAALLWWYMAMNIGANDVANSVWPAVWSKTITLGWAIFIAAVWNVAWALIAGWDVVKTVKKWIIDISWFTEPSMFIFAMLAALIAASVWLHLATFLRAPVSTTHSIVWWVMWAWIGALWFSIVSWPTMWKIAASWVISPVLWWIIAAAFLYWIKKTIIFQDDKITQAKKWVPLFVAIMAWAFSTYLIIKWLKQVIKFEFLEASIIWLVIAILVFFVVRIRLYKSKKSLLENDRKAVNKLFTIPLIFAVALLTFAHWANDVANAIWPLAAIYDSVMNNAVNSKVWIPLWVMLIGWVWIAVWLSLYWPRIIKTVWSEITELDQIRAFSIALSAALTVILASQLGLPVSSTHIALGWVFWVWFLREYLEKKQSWKKEKYVERKLLWKIISAWLITVPVVAFLAAMVFILLNTFLA